MRINGNRISFDEGKQQRNSIRRFVRKCHEIRDLISRGVREQRGMKAGGTRK
jgi:hypothetical protein